MENKILLQELAEGLARRKGMTKREADTFVRTVFEIIEYYLQTDKMVKVKGLGTFKLVSVESRESVNVNTGERIQIKGHTKVSFTPDTSLRDQINKPFAEFETVILHENTSVEEMERIDDVPDVAEETPSEETFVEELIEDETPAEPIEEDMIVEDAQEEDAPAIAETNTPDAIEEKQEEIPAEEPQTMESTKDEEQEKVVPPAEVASASESTPTSEQKRSSKGKVFAGIILVLLLMVGSFFIGHYQSDIFSAKREVVNQPIAKPTPAKKVQSAKQTTDSLAQKAAKTDSLDVKAPKSELSNALADSSKYEQVPDGEFLIVGTQGTHTVANGQTIRIVAEKVYGKRSFASYIIVHNKIEKPDAIEIGTVLNLPKLEPRSK